MKTDGSFAALVHSPHYNSLHRVTTGSGHHQAPGRCRLHSQLWLINGPWDQKVDHGLHLMLPSAVLSGRKLLNGPPTRQQLIVPSHTSLPAFLLIGWQLSAKHSTVLLFLRCIVGLVCAAATRRWKRTFSHRNFLTIIQDTPGLVWRDGVVNVRCLPNLNQFHHRSTHLAAPGSTCSLIYIRPPLCQLGAH